MEQIALPKFKISNIEIESFSLSDLGNKRLNKTNVEFGVAVDVRLLLDKNILRSRFIFSVYDSNNEDDIYCELRTKVDFKFSKKLENIVTELNKKNKKAVLPKQLHASLVAIAISTNRGIIYSKLVGTALENIYLPIVDPNFFISGKEEVDIVLKSKK